VVASTQTFYHGSVIKDLKYDKFFVIGFDYRDGKYVLCYPDDKYKFVPINQIAISKLKECKVVKFKTKDDAKKHLTTIPEFDINGADIIFQVLENSYHEYLIGV
jgi:hypothetical protein